MNRNVEIKARVDSLTVIRDRVKALASESPLVLVQEDTFFNSICGRLKLRQFADSQEGELIYYQRADRKGPKESHYIVHRTRDPESLKEVLSLSLGVHGVVRKRRELFHVGQTRVHLDEVDGLGIFAELEVVLRADQDPSEGMAIATRLMEQLGISNSQLVDRAYLDLLDDTGGPQKMRR
jgi:predicted adenylyl cyclase CyaB